MPADREVERDAVLVCCGVGCGVEAGATCEADRVRGSGFSGEGANFSF